MCVGVVRCIRVWLGGIEVVLIGFVDCRLELGREGGDAFLV